jgi:hypothetical protein
LVDIIHWLGGGYGLRHSLSRNGVFSRMHGRVRNISPGACARPPAAQVKLNHFAGFCIWRIACILRPCWRHRN